MPEGVILKYAPSLGVILCVNKNDYFFSDSLKKT
jgi:hypothetical protein